MNPITLYTAACRGEVGNTVYPEKRIITNTDQFKAAMAFDHVGAEYKDFYRKNENYITSDCLMMDCDNDHSDRPGDWVSPEIIRDSMPGLPFYVCFSRHNYKIKKGKSPRPRFHVYFAIEPVTDYAEYRRFKENVISQFPQFYFDKGAKDAARFFFGVSNPQVMLMGGEV